MSSTPHVHELSFPIFGRKVGSQAGDEWATIATGFFVLPGIIATAKHVLMNKYDTYLEAEDLSIIQYAGKNGHMHFRQRELTNIVYHPEYDVAVGLLEPAHDGCELCANHKKFQLTSDAQNAGDSFNSIGFQQTKFGDKILKDVFPTDKEIEILNPDEPTVNPDIYFQKIELKPSIHPGRIIAYHSDGHRYVKGPCYTTGMMMPSGLSGGPVINKDGKVFAINSRGFKDVEFSTVISIESLLDMKLPDIKHNNLSLNCTIRELILRLKYPLD